MDTKPQPEITLFAADVSTALELPLFETGINAGFPSPAGDFMELKIDLNEYMVRNPSATFYGRVNGDSMRDIGINEGDIAVIDRSLDLVNNKIALCYVDGGFTIKTVRMQNKECWLIPANANFKPVQITEENQFIVWGIVTFIIKKF
ncbi:MAG: translesion error-prone DNA polymerase V autoproteolytic subunit [Bacteroidia bacterium]|nr:translesion error-prone DNA polymerase V autoproteolytic subunit [Bacteroidia bacterium]MBP7261054.1 translesion error-prone DNA polymerase V autoproteolytic subunit [Bacteroidia bacterium]MBP9178979.1 translesion error-prone DNA polymerase V autoproteolytic subunit [Bacteroidia bacterium]MBP9723280.1 translesion error-prone DNA polymerase V autoproteolytic subunit [Bacteroidia bacterium]